MLLCRRRNGACSNSRFGNLPNNQTETILLSDSDDNLKQTGGLLTTNGVAADHSIVHVCAQWPH